MKTIAPCLLALALADDDCDAPIAHWQPRDAVLRMAAEQGWQVQRLKIDDGCYEIRARPGGTRPQKIPGCFRTGPGADTFFTIRSYLATMHKQKHNLFACLVSVFERRTIEPCLAG